MRNRYFCAIKQRIIQNIFRRFRGINVYMFHQVNNDESKWLDSTVSMHMDSFIDFIDTLKAKNAIFVSPGALDGRLEKNLVVISFDDIFEDACIYAIEYLQKCKIPYTVFVSDSYIDKPLYVKTDELNKLLGDSLCTVGYHTKDHRMMNNLSNQEITKQIDDTDFINSIGISSINEFAFPYGSIFACPPRAYKCAGDKYLHIYSTISAPYSDEWRKHFGKIIPRINVNENNYKDVLSRF